MLAVRFIPARAGNADASTAVAASSTVHPRAGGEREENITERDVQYGSSPRGRGTRGLIPAPYSLTRFIPARAGNARDGMVVRILADGSSPRGRGTPDRRAGPRLSRRFIPARAGNAPFCWRTMRTCSVHPRAGGERAGEVSSGVGESGSSPRGRGTRSGLGSRMGCPGFIPARAGNALIAAWRPVSTFGSSPRGRGTLRPARDHQIQERFIPARAGNAARRYRRPRLSPVHPRAGGERPGTTPTYGASIGSSPRGRGTLGAQVDHRPALRFIPARAGNAFAAVSRTECSSVHPRAGGERSAVVGSSPAAFGSSPRGRGTQRRWKLRWLRQRFIPARAGNAAWSTR